MDAGPTTLKESQLVESTEPAISTESTPPTLPHPEILATSCKNQQFNATELRGVAPDNENFTSLNITESDENIDQPNYACLTNLTKNKRKNFNPRYSCNVDDNQNPNVNLISIDPHEISLQKLLSAVRSESQGNENLIARCLEAHAIPSGALNNNLQKNQLLAKSSFVDIDNNGSKTNCATGSSLRSIELKTLKKNSRQCRKVFLGSQKNKIYHPVTASSPCDDKTSNIDDAQQLIKAASVIRRTSATTATAPGQSKIEFACNAFNAVQELLNVYGLSISPGDIVDAFKKQAVIGDTTTPSPQQPSTPSSGQHSQTRSPPSSVIRSTAPATTTTQPDGNGARLNNLCQVNIDIADLSEESNDTQLTFDNVETVTTLSKTSERLNDSDDCNNDQQVSPPSPHHYLKRSIDRDADSELRSETSLTVTPVSKLMATKSPANVCNSNLSGDEHSIDEHNYDDFISNNDYQRMKRISSATYRQYSATIATTDSKDGDGNDTDEHEDDYRPTINDDNTSSKAFDFSRFSNDYSSNIDNINNNSDEYDNDDQNDDGIPRDEDFIDNHPGNSELGSTSSNLSMKNVGSLLDKCPMGLFSPMLQLAQLQSEDKQLYNETGKFLTRFSSYMECKSNQCELENLREHYHCFDVPCFGKILSKKEEIIRHIKWHKKRNESLNHGFLRFSSSDDCSPTFGVNCQHNRKQTHYHCFQPNCDKVYISTSDVQMHSNYHRKDSAIFQEGFQRYRGTEECNAEYCPFSGQRTTHFHCRRDNCRYTFKNKADMEKHKSYHIKDLQLARDGFKKFLKTESCPYERCRFSRICNHIHCVRENCYYVLHSSGQLLSHKRKHERMDSEQAYKQFKIVQKAAVESGILTTSDFGQLGKTSSFDWSNSKPSTPSSSTSTVRSPDLQHMTTSQQITSTISTSTAATSGNTNNNPLAISFGPTSSAGGTKLSDTDDNCIINNSEDTDNSIKLSMAAAIVKQEFNTKDLRMLNTLPIDIIQQFQQQQQQQQQHQQQQQTTTTLLQRQIQPIGGSEFHLLDVLMSNHRTQQTSNQSNDDTIRSMMLGLNFENIEQFIYQYFTDNCTGQPSPQPPAPSVGNRNDNQTEPLNLKNTNFDQIIPIAIDKTQKSLIDTTSGIKSTTKTSKNCNENHSVNRKIDDRIECFMTANDMHLHCLIKGCEAVIPKNLYDISEHIRIHDLSRHDENILINSNNLLQITSIDGFFNRKRGRPPKNRVVEVYNNVQQSPQAIFTSFKLEKSQSEQNCPSWPSMVSRSSTPVALRQHGSTPVTDSIASPLVKNVSVNYNRLETIEKLLTDKKFRVYQEMEKCNCTECIYENQMHFHCNYSKNCHFMTNFGSLMDKHMKDIHDSLTPIDNYNFFDHFEYFERGIHCELVACGLSKVFSHFHCKKCRLPMQFVADIKLHMNNNCPHQRLNNEERHQDVMSILGRTIDNDSNHNQSTTTMASDKMLSNTANNCTKNLIDNIYDDMRIEETNNLLIGLSKSMGGDDTDPINSISIKSESSEDEKVSVVRAAGTFFPQNSCDTSASVFNLTAAKPPNQIIGNQPESGSKMCERPFCKLKRKQHEHCELCNQAFSDTERLKIHRLKHSTTRLSNLFDASVTNPNDLTATDTNRTGHDDEPQDLSKVISSKLRATKTGLSTAHPIMETTSSICPQQLPTAILPQHFIDNFSMQNLHLAQMALLQQKSLYYQNLYPFLSVAAAAATKHGAITNAELLQTQMNQHQNDQISRTHPDEHHQAATTTAATQQQQQQLLFNSKQHCMDSSKIEIAGFPFVGVAAAAAAAAAAAVAATTSNRNNENTKIPIDGSTGQLDIMSSEVMLATEPPHHKQQKRKLDDYHSLIESRSAKKLLKTLTAAAGTPSSHNKPSSSMQGPIVMKESGGSFKMFKDEPIPHGYLKFRFNEDCNFANCGYRNHQSHFHCCRNDCFYSFCDKTRFVQHTARHERLDKLMGDDFKQYRANMRCGYEDCVYSKNLAGQNNKSSHFHCLKCDFICSDTNKVVAHRRQHSKMEYIRMAGFRKVANNEKCIANINQSSNKNLNSAVSAASTTTNVLATTDNGTESPNMYNQRDFCISSTTATTPAVECTYSLKQTHYHCLVCDCSVLSRAQLGSHRHRV